MLNKIHLKTKLLLLLLFFIGLTVIIFNAISYYYGEISSEETIQQRLSNAQSVQQEFFAQYAKQLELISLLVSSEPAFVSYVAEAINFYKKEKKSQYLTSIADLLQERKQQYSFDFAIITDGNGVQMAHSEKIISVVKDLSSNKLLSQSMQELQPVKGYWYENQQLFQSSVVPIAQGQNLVGFLITAKKIDNITLTNLSQLSGTQIMLILKNKSYAVLASSADVGLTQSFEDSINANTTSLDSQHNNKLIKIKINRHPYIINTKLLEQADANTSLLLSSAVSRDALLAPVLKTRFVLVITALIIALLAMFFTLFLLKSFFKELKVLSKKITSIGDNTFNPVIKTQNPELHNLNTNLNQLASEVIGKTSLAKHMVEVSKKTPAINDYFWVASETEIIKPNQTIGGRFKILQKIGSGGMGLVFQALDTELNELIALKVLKKTDNDIIQIAQLKDEIKFSRKIHNPNVVRIHDFGKIGGHVFISMEYIMGYSIADVLKISKKLRPAAAKYTALQICKGLDAVHNAGIIHRDLKPENMMIELDNTVKLMDFGIASIQSHVSKNQQSEMIEGSISYCAPEQLQGKGADERSDIYALGTIIMEIFCGKRPFEAQNEEELMYKKVSTPAANISDYWASAPKQLEQIIAKCLQLDPNKRYQNITELVNDLRQLPL